MNDAPRSRPAFGLNRWDWSSPAAFANDVRRAEQLGWDFAFTPVNPLALWDPYVLLAGAALRTTRIRLGTLIENAVLDHPVSVASSIATLDAVSNGRALLGYGIGDTAVRYMGLSPATVNEMETALRAVTGFLHGEPVDIEGGRRMNHARPVPVWMAAGGPRTLRMCGRIADGVFVRVGRHPDNLRHAVAQVHAGAAEAGRNPDDVRIALIFHTIMSDDTAEIRAIARSMAAGYYEYSPNLFSVPGFEWNGPPIQQLQQQVVPDFHHTDALLDAGRLVSFLSDEIAESFAIFGSDEEIAEQINNTLDLGFHVDLVVPHPVPVPATGQPVPRSIANGVRVDDYMTWFARHVIARVHTKEGIQAVTPSRLY
jgi:5,10-methylenetetrahydromethanopterin reductase